MRGRTASPRTPDDRRPNVLFVLIDTLRADHLEPYGYERPTSPNLAALAERSLVVERTFAQAPWTKPSVASLFTSLHPEQHRALHDGSQNRLPDRLTTLAEVLTAAGWRTAGYSENPHVQEVTGFAQGFGVFEGTPGFHSDTKWVLGRVLAWLRGAPRDAPFFLYAHFLDPHGPYTSGEVYRETFVGDAQVANPIVLDGRFIELIDEDDRSELSETEIDYLERLYDTEIRSVDGAIGRILAVLEQEGLADDTIVVVTSDHGEEFQEHGGMKHGCRVFDEALRIPLVVHVPGMEPRRWSGGAIQHVDLAPTLVELVGLRVVPQFRGRSFAALVRGEDLPPQTVFSSTRWRGRDLRAVRSEPWKLIADMRSDERLLFRVDVDPGEREDVSKRHPEVVRELEQMLERYASPFEGLSDADAIGPGSADIDKALADIGYGGE